MRYCNQNCYYCNNSDCVSNDFEYVVDLDYLNWILEIYNKFNVKDIKIEISGGEPALIKNIYELVELLNTKSYITQIYILSNGLLRKKVGNVKAFIGNKYHDYHEHNVLDIVDKDIIQFYNDINIYDKKDYGTYAVILTETTLKSLLDNFDYFKDTKLFEQPIHFKFLTPKTYYPSQETLEDTKRFYRKLLALDNLTFISRYVATERLAQLEETINLNKTTLCAKISRYQFIDMQNKTIGLCSKQVYQSPAFAITEDDIKKALDGTLFTPNDFCDKCYASADMSEYYIKRRIKGQYINVGGQ